MEENKNKDSKVEVLSDNDLEEATAGSNLTLHFFDTEEQVRFIFFPGDTVYVKENIFCKTVCCKVVSYEAFYDPQYHCYEDLYIVRDPEGLLRKVLRDDIVNQVD